MKEFSPKKENKLYIINEEKEETKNTNQINNIENNQGPNLLETLNFQIIILINDSKTTIYEKY